MSTPVVDRVLVTPRREDHGNLIVLHLYGRYREMGRQQVELLYRQAREYLDRFPRYNHQFLVAPMRKWVADGLAAPQVAGRLPLLPHLQRVP